MSLGFLKRGEAVTKAVAEVNSQQQMKEAQKDLPFRYFLKKGAEGSITFLDGSLDDSGSLETVSWWEHNLNLNGSWGNYFTCTQDVEPCPICEGGDGPALMFGFTVLDHTPYTIKNGPNAGKILQDTRKFFACKKMTYEYLITLAKKRGGLAGVRFDVMRIGDKSAAVGSQFDFTSKTEDLAAIPGMFNIKPEDAVAYDYEKIIMFQGADVLREQGFGQIQPLGHQDGPPAATAPPMAAPPIAAVPPAAAPIAEGNMADEL